MKDVTALMAGLSTRRFHVIPMVAGETVGHHSALVAGLLLILWPNVSRNVLVAAITHDLAEYVTGDLPSTSKRLGIVDRKALAEQEAAVLKAAGLQDPQLSDEEALQLKTADVLAGMAACVHERMLGNLYIAEVFLNFSSYFQELGHSENSRASDVYSFLHSRFYGKPYLGY